MIFFSPQNFCSSAIANQKENSATILAIDEVAYSINLLLRGTWINLATVWSYYTGVIAKLVKLNDFLTTKCWCKATLITKLNWTRLISNWTFNSWIETGTFFVQLYRTFLAFEQKTVLFESKQCSPWAPRPSIAFLTERSTPDTNIKLRCINYARPTLEYVISDFISAS